MNGRQPPLSISWTWKLREGDGNAITIRGSAVLDGGGGAALRQPSTPAIRPRASDPPRPAIISQAQISSDGAGGKCQ